MVYWKKLLASYFNYVALFQTSWNRYTLLRITTRSFRSIICTSILVHNLCTYYGQKASCSNLGNLHEFHYALALKLLYYPKIIYFQNMKYLKVWHSYFSVIVYAYTIAVRKTIIISLYIVRVKTTRTTKKKN